MRISVYKAGSKVFYAVFDAVGSDKETWIERSRILESSATDILTEAVTEAFFFTLHGWVMLISLNLVTHSVT